MRISSKIKDRESFTPTENEIIRFIQTNSDQAVNMTLDELAETIYVSKSTIIRFCKKLGYRGHHEMCVELAKELSMFIENDANLDTSMPLTASDNARTAADKIAAIHYRAVTETHQDLDIQRISELAAKIRDCRELYIYAFEECVFAAMDFAMKLRRIGFRVQTAMVSGSEQYIASTQPEDTAALLITYTGREAILSQCAQVLAAKHIPIYLVIGPFRSRIRNYADASLEISYYEAEPKTAPFGSETAMRVVLDMLYALIFQIDYEKNVSQIRKIYDLRRGIADTVE